MDFGKLFRKKTKNKKTVLDPVWEKYTKKYIYYQLLGAEPLQS